jgi:ribosome-binding protein aMBF1 (putative translation factor)
MQNVSAPNGAVDLAHIRQAVCINGDTGRSLWRVVDDVRKQEGVSLEQLAKRLGYCRSALQKRRERATGTERLCEAAAMFDALGWKLTLTAKRDA